MYTFSILIYNDFKVCCLKSGVEIPTSDDVGGFSVRIEQFTQLDIIIFVFWTLFVAGDRGLRTVHPYKFDIIE